jgi:hypothetical protein
VLFSEVVTESATACDDGVEDGGAFAGFGIADEQPIFLTEGVWSDPISD